MEQSGFFSRSAAVSAWAFHLIECCWAAPCRPTIKYIRLCLFPFSANTVALFFFSLAMPIEARKSIRDSSFFSDGRCCSSPASLLPNPGPSFRLPMLLMPLQQLTPYYYIQHKACKEGNGGPNSIAVRRDGGGRRNFSIKRRLPMSFSSRPQHNILALYTVYSIAPPI